MEPIYSNFELATLAKEFLTNNFIFFSLQDYTWTQQYDEETYPVTVVQIQKLLVKFIAEYIEINNIRKIEEIYTFVVLLYAPDVKIFTN